MTSPHPCPPGFRFSDTRRVRGCDDRFAVNPASQFSQRMRRVFKQYPDPWVGIWTFEIVTSPRTIYSKSYYLESDTWKNDTRAAEHQIELDAGPGGAAAAYRGMLAADRHYDPIVGDLNSVPDELSALVPWVAKEVNRLRKHPEQPIVFFDALANDLSEVADWAAATRPNVMGMTVTEVLRTMRDWHADMVERARQQSRVAEEGVAIYRWSDGWRADLLDQHSQLVAEGCAMGHCLGEGGYWEEVERGSTRIVSLRDQRGASKLTLQLELERGDPSAIPFDRGSYYWALTQAKGFGNRLPRPGECVRVSELGLAFEWQLWSGDLSQCGREEYQEAFLAMEDAGVRGEMTAEGEEAFFA